MRSSIAKIVVVHLVLWGGGWVAGLAQPYGLSNRVANATLRLPPDPPRPPSYSYATTNAFGNLPFTDPVKGRFPNAFVVA